VILTRSLARTMFEHTALSFFLLCITVFVSQLVRLGPLVITAGSDPIGFLTILGDTLPRMIAMALPFSLPLGAFLAVDRLEKRKVSQTISALGAPPRQTWLSAAALFGAAAAIFCAPFSWHLEGAAARRFPDDALHLARESVIATIKPGMVTALGDSLSVLAGARQEGGPFEYVTVMADRNVLSGSNGTLSGQGTDLELRLDSADLWRHTPAGLHRGFAKSIKIKLPAAANVTRNMGFFAPREALSLRQLLTARGSSRETRRRLHLGWQRLMTPFFVFVLPLFGVAVALLLPAAFRLVGGVLATVVVIGTYLVGESFTLAGAPPALVNAAPVGFGLIVAWLARRGEARGEATIR
jgi:lipopolysaccharide export LptBFGC system permease protein LptF